MSSAMSNTILRVAAAFALILFLSVSDSSAQWSAGLRGGLNLSNATFSAGYGTRANTGLIIGAGLSYRLNDWASIRMEPQYIQKGISISGSFLAPGGSFQADTSEWVTPDFRYIEIPLMLSIQTELGDLGLEVFTGINPAILLSGRVHHQRWGGQDLETTETEEIDSTMEPYDMAFDLGVGASFKVAPGVKVVGDIRQSLGLVKVIDWFSLHSSPHEQWYKNLDVKIMAGVMFEL